MITSKRINSSEAEAFKPLWDLYEDAFPTDERRPLNYQVEAMQYEQYHFEALYDAETLIGFVAWWQTASHIYIEHFATFPHLRNKGYGSLFLEQFSKFHSSPILLEVEAPEGDLTKRRIAFYERIGFVLNEHPYAHPSYHGAAPVQLKIMTYPHAISAEELDEFKQKGFPLIHFRYRK